MHKHGNMGQGIYVDPAHASSGLTSLSARTKANVIRSVGLSIHLTNAGHSMNSTQNYMAGQETFIRSSAKPPISSHNCMYRDSLAYPQGIETPKTLFNLTAALLGRGYKKEDIATLWGGNWLRVMKAVIG